MHRRSEKYIAEGSKYEHWIGLCLSFHLNLVLGPFVHGRLQNLQTSEVTFAHVITPLTAFITRFSFKTFLTSGVTIGASSIGRRNYYKILALTDDTLYSGTD